MIGQKGCVKFFVGGLTDVCKDPKIQVPQI